MAGKKAKKTRAAKTSRAANKRFILAANNRMKRKKANRNHILTKKDAKRKMHLRGPGIVVDKTDEKRVLRLLKLAS